MGGIFALDTLQEDETNATPTVAIGTVDRAVGTVTVPITVFDADNETVTLTVQSDTGSGWTNTSLTGTTVAATKEGNREDLSWNAEADLGTGYHASVSLRISASDRREQGPATISSSFPVGNDDPALTSITADQPPSGEEPSDKVVIRFQVEDSSSDSVDITAFEVSVDGGSNWDSLNLSSTGAIGIFPSGSLSGLLTSPNPGEEHAITWNSLSPDHPYPGNYTGVQVRISIEDTFGGTHQLVSTAFNLENNEAPKADVFDLRGIYHGVLAIQYTLSDEEDNVNVLVRYSYDEQTWFPATYAGGDPVTGLDPGIPQEPNVYTFLWDTLADNVSEADDIYLEVVPFDQYQQGLSSVTASLSVVNGPGADVMFIDRRPIPNIAVAPASVTDSGNGLIYVFGGENVGYPHAYSQAYIPRADAWEDLTDMIYPRSYAMAAQLNGKLYVMGGFLGAPYWDNTNYVESYDPSTEAWTPQTVLPTELYGAATASMGGKIYLFGGVTGTYATTLVESDKVVVYDGTTASILATPIQGGARVNARAVVVNGLIYVIGGAVDTLNTPAFPVTPVSRVDIFDPVTETWSGSGIVIPTEGRQGVAIGVVDHKIVMAGGIAADGSVSDMVEVYDPLTNTWETSEAGAGNAPALVTPLYEKQGNGAYGVVDGRLYTISGNRAGGQEATQVVEYTPAVNTWRTDARTLADSHAFHGQVTMDDKAYIVGGLSATSGVTQALEIYDPSTDSWSAGSLYPGEARFQFAYATDGSKLWIAGGSTGAATSGVLDEYDQSTGLWNASLPPSSTMPTPVEAAVGAYYDGKFYVIGGRNASGVRIGTVQIYDVATQTWSTGLADLPTPRTTASAVVYGDRIYVMGGTSDLGFSDAVEIYDPVMDAWETGPSMPRPRGAHASTVYRGAIYVIGGNGTQQTTTSVDVFLPWNGTWHTSPLIETRATGMHASTIAGRILMTGGYTSEPLDTCEWFTSHVRTGEVALADTPTAREAPGVTANRVGAWVTGGYNASGDALGTTASYVWLDGTYTGDTFTPAVPTGGSTYQAHVWETGPTMPAGQQRGGHVQARIGDVTYLVGGSHTKGGTPLNSVLAYDHSTEAWVTSPAPASMNQARAYAASVVIDGKLYVLGGTDFSTTQISVEVYDPALNTWSNAPFDLFSARSHAAALAVGTQILVFGGKNASGDPAADVQVIDTADATPTWLPLASLPTATASPVLLSDRGLFLAGGTTATGPTNRVYAYDMTADAWESAGTLATARSEMGAGVALDLGTFLIGGVNATGTPLATASLATFSQH